MQVKLKVLFEKLDKIQRVRIAKQSIMNNGKIYIVEDLNHAVEISNRIAPEHLELCVKSPDNILKR